MVLIFAALLMSAAFARAQVPDVAPRWQREVAGSPCGDNYYSIDARVDAGVLVRMNERLAAYTPDGNLRWQVSVDCSGPSHTRWEKAILTADGGAWAIASGSGYGVHMLQRFDPQGQVGVAVALEFDSSFVGSTLFGDDDAAIVVLWDGFSVEWRRLDSASGRLEMRSHELSDYYRLFGSARLLDDGGVGVSLGIFPCDLGVCPPPPRIYDIARLGPDGGLRWQVGGVGVPVLDAQGGADIVVVDVYNQEPPQFLRRVTPAGEVEADVALSGISGRLRGVYGPHAGRVVIRTVDESDAYSLWSLDRAGNLLASRTFDANVVVLESAQGFLVKDPDADPSCLQWIDPGSLRPRACFRFDQAAAPYAGFDQAQLLGVGILYATYSAPTDDAQSRIVLARFDAPALDAAERRHRARAARAILRAPALRPSAPRSIDAD